MQQHINKLIEEGKIAECCNYACEKLKKESKKNFNKKKNALCYLHYIMGLMKSELNIEDYYKHFERAIQLSDCCSVEITCAYACCLLNHNKVEEALQWAKNACQIPDYVVFDNKFITEEKKFRESERWELMKILHVNHFSNIDINELFKDRENKPMQDKACKETEIIA